MQNVHQGACGIGRCRISQTTHLLFRLNEQILIDVGTQKALIAIVLHQAKYMILKTNIHK